MSLGILPYLLYQSKQVFENAYPGEKITAPGFLNSLLRSDRPTVVESGIADGSGHVRTARIKYRTRMPKGVSRTTDDCTINRIPAYSEAAIPTTSFRAIGLHLPDALIAQFEKESSNIAPLNTNPVLPGGGAMMEIYNMIMETANGLFGDINDDLLALLSFGTNAVSGSSSARTINFTLSNSNNYLDSGMGKLIQDTFVNQVNIQDCYLVGNGLINQYYIQQPAKSADFAGLNTSQLALPKLYYDQNTYSAWGSNHFGLFEKNAVQLVNINRFAGFRGGDKLTTQLGTMTLPVKDVLGNGELSNFKFDYQLSYVSCPTEVNVNGVTTSIDRGWVLQLMSSYTLFQVPSDAYDSTDPLTGVNGAYHYLATNS